MLCRVPHVAPVGPQPPPSTPSREKSPLSSPTATCGYPRTWPRHLRRAARAHPYLSRRMTWGPDRGPTGIRRRVRLSGARRSSCGCRVPCEGHSGRGKKLTGTRAWSRRDH
ncbi:hypothetical protein NL676_027958 [Syzygium grande]|nr:hypothetical protein NL676_027958 [Syzygium grande]